MFGSKIKVSILATPSVVNSPKWVSYDGIDLAIGDVSFCHSGWQLQLTFRNDDCFHLQSVRGELSYIAFDSARVLDECLRVDPSSILVKATPAMDSMAWVNVNPTFSTRRRNAPFSG